MPQLFEDVCGFDIFIAGSGGFVEACERAVIELGARRTRVHTEPFFSDPQPWTSSAAMEPRSASL
jgi:CDP-4-dehydro-6-deoxyglucose reductase